MYKDKEKEREAARVRMQRMRAHVTPAEDVTPFVTPETVTPGEVDVTPLVPGVDGKMKPYNPETDGVDGWHTTDKGMKYIRQDTGMGGMVRRYGPGARMFRYR